ncbi:NAD-dependent epimerase/dehydratase family protein [Roseivirga sp. BDSF3-8]|uniref:NAD-dependent epimerase/dehydratase family protein n=1 Tax=Roseivirga sp. BDSF3-8 TaxID=3241598 RepID=UPI003531DE2A
MQTLLVIGASGQVGSDLVDALRKQHGEDRVIASDIREPETDRGRFIKLDATDTKGVEEAIRSNKVTQVYQLVATLSATGERNPMGAWKLNMQTLLDVLEMARDLKLSKVYWPSSIAAFGSHTPATDTPQNCIMDPDTVYGISKLAGERWCEYFHKKFGVDVRSLRYPGLIGYKALPGGGTTDYAVDIYHKAVRGEEFLCPLKSNTCLPMMYMDDAIRATIELMEADPDRISVRSSYNLSAFSFTPDEIAKSIRKYIPDFVMGYDLQPRLQGIADSWPNSIDSSRAAADWDWKPAYDLDRMSEEMILQLGKNLPAG